MESIYKVTRYVLTKYEINVATEATTMTTVQIIAKYFWNLLFAN